MYQRLTNKARIYLIDERRYPITLDADGIVTQPYVIAPLPAPDASFAIVASFVIGNDIIAEDIARFGIRPDGFPAGVPDHILHTKVPSLDVPGILDRLEQGAKRSNRKQPVELQIGSEMVKVRVEKLELLAKGVEVPGLGRPPVFAGQVIDEDGREVPGSSVVFTVTNDELGDMQLGGVVQMPGTGEGIPPGSMDAMWIEPLGLLTHDHQGGNAPQDDRHLMYHSKDTVPATTGHADPIPQGPSPEVAIQLEEETMRQQTTTEAATVPTVKYDVAVQIYTDHGGSFTWGYHWDLYAFWANEIRNKFVNILRRTGTNYVTVDSVSASKWLQIPATDFSNNDCIDIVRKFRFNAEVGKYGAIRPNTLQVLFTNRVMKDAAGNGQAGCAYLGHSGRAGPNRRMYSVTSDVYGFNWDSLALLQEIGHNLDWHEDWTWDSTGVTGPHDPHLSPQIQQSINHFHSFFSRLHCSAMRGPYGKCPEPQATYSFGNLAPLQHLAEGIAEMF